MPTAGTVCTDIPGPTDALQPKLPLYPGLHPCWCCYAVCGMPAQTPSASTPTALQHQSHSALSTEDLRHRDVRPPARATQSNPHSCLHLPNYKHVCSKERCLCCTYRCIAILPLPNRRRCFSFDATRGLAKSDLRAAQPATATTPRPHTYATTPFVCSATPVSVDQTACPRTLQAAT